MKNNINGGDNMYYAYAINDNNYLQHYGVKGMKWGVRRAKNPVLSEKKAAYKQAKKDYNKAYNKAYNRAVAAYSPIKKHRQANDARWEDAANKAEKLNTAKTEYKQAKKEYKSNHPSSLSKVANNIAYRRNTMAANASQKDADNLRKHGYKEEADAVQKVSDKYRTKAANNLKKMANKKVSDINKQMTDQRKKEIENILFPAKNSSKNKIVSLDRKSTVNDVLFPTKKHENNNWTEKPNKKQKGNI